jgi:transposase
MNELLPIPAVGEPATDTIMRGSKMRIYPKAHQAATMDLWRRRCIQLWNLLLSLEQAAYSGEKARVDLGWRSIWAQVVEESHVEAVRVAREGKRRKDGTFRKQPGERKEPPPLDGAFIDKIRVRIHLDCAVHPESGAVTPAQPRLFMWEHELQKIMARLKQVSCTQWIGDLPSHAAQSVVKDLIKALQAMLRERKKRAAGAGGRDTGFPKFKKNRYAAGSVYFANTQLKFEVKRRRDADGRDKDVSELAWVKFPNGVGWMECRMPRHIANAFQDGRADLMGGRIWRQGEDWFLSCQWKVPKPEALPATGRTAAIKIAAAIPITIVDNRGQTREHAMPPIDKELLAAHAAAGRAQSRTLEARKMKAKKREAYAKKRHAQKLERGIAAKAPGRARIRLTPGFYRAAAKLAKLEAHDADKRDAWLHEITTHIVRSFDVIAVQRMEVAKLMKKPTPPEEKEEQVKAPWQGKRRSLKTARVMMRRTAMARIQTTLKYKAIDLRGKTAYEEISPLDVTAGACSSCGVLHPEWKMLRAKGREIMRCQEAMPDGRTCNTVLTYTRNSARVIGRELAVRLAERQKA